MKDLFSLVVPLYSQFWFPIVILFALNSFLFLYFYKIVEKANFNPISSPPALKITKADFILLLTLSLAVFLWKTIRLGCENIDVMESTNVWLFQTLRTNMATFTENCLRWAHQPLYPFSFGLFTKWLSRDDCAYLFRFFSVIFSILTAWLVYLYSLKMVREKTVSFMAFIMVNISGLLSFYSRRVEVYSIFCFFALLSYYYFWNIFIARDEKRLWKYWAASMVCFFTHYLTIGIIFSQLLAISLLKYKRTISKEAFFGFIKSLIFFNFFNIFLIPPIYVSFFKKPLFAMPYSNLYYLDPGSLPLVIGELVRFFLGIPACSLLLLLLSVLIYIYILLQLFKKNAPLVILITSIVITSILYEICFLYGVFVGPGGIYFNIRHFIYFVPFTAIIFGYGCFLARKERKVLIKFALAAFLSWLVCWNVCLTSKINFEQTGPSYKKAFAYIKHGFNEKTDIITMPCDWFAIILHAELDEAFDPAVYHWEGKLYMTALQNILKNKKKFERIWAIVPREYIFSIPHLDMKRLDRYVGYLKRNFKLESSWQGEKIAVYLLTVR